MTDKKNVVIDIKTDEIPSIADAVKEMLKEGFTVNVILSRPITRGKEKGEWTPITRIQLRAWK